MPRRKGRHKPKPEWRDVKRQLGSKTMICRDCGRKVTMQTATVLEMQAKKEPIVCLVCGGKLFPI